MIHINVAGNRLTATTDTPLVSKTVGVVMFEAEFDDSWDGYQRKIVFTGKGGEASVWYTGGIMEVPWQSMDAPGILRISAVGLAEGKRDVTAMIEMPLLINKNGSLGDAPADQPPGLTVLEQVELSCIQSEGRAKAAAEKSEIKALESEASAESSARSAAAAEVSRVRAVEAEDNAQFFMGQSKEAAAGAVQAMEQAQEAENRTEELAESAAESSGKAEESRISAEDAAQKAKVDLAEANKKIEKNSVDISALKNVLIRNTREGSLIAITDCADFPLLEFEIDTNTDGVEIAIGSYNRCDSSKAKCKDGSTPESFGNGFVINPVNDGVNTVIVPCKMKKGLTYSFGFKWSFLGTDRHDYVFYIPEDNAEVGNSYTAQKDINYIGIRAQNNYTGEDNAIRIYDFIVRQDSVPNVWTPFREEVVVPWNGELTRKLATLDVPTVISNRAGANMRLEYVVDTKKYIDNKLAELTALTLEV